MHDQSQDVHNSCSHNLNQANSLIIEVIVIFILKCVPSSYDVKFLKIVDLLLKIVNNIEIVVISILMTDINILIEHFNA